MERTAERTFLAMARSRLVVHLSGQIHACLDTVSDQHVWWRPNARSNAIGNLVLHCIGSTRHYIGHVVGGTGFVRERDTEFSEQTRSTHELRSGLDVAIAEADEVLRTFDPSRLVEPADKIPTPTTYMEVIGLQVAHYAAHTGQIAYATKLLTDGALDDIWRKTPTR